MTEFSDKIKDILDNYKELREKILIQEAYLVAIKTHGDQKRMSGEPYIEHPLWVARYLSELGMDSATVAAALLHDTIEDTGMTHEHLEKLFGTEVAFLVEGVTKLNAITYSKRPGLRKSKDPHVESLKKMFFAMAEDVRVIFIKLADRYHNIKTLQFQDAESQKRIAIDTLEIYAPIAGRLAMGHLKGELEDMAFPFAYPGEYSALKKKVKDIYSNRLKYIERVMPMIKMHLANAGINIVSAHARVKHLYSLYQKIIRYGMDLDNMDLNKIFDLVALRIIVPDIKSCYETLGTLHAHYKPLPGRIKDYIAVPKPNGYRSLHTTIFCEKGHLVEVQIRTPDMHEHAENGVAAHWTYSETGKKKSFRPDKQQLLWIIQLKKYLTELKTKEGLKSLKIDFFKNRIFAFTPHGDVKDLPEGATPIDFAYAIHSGLGNTVQGAKVNGKMIALDSELQNGDVVEIIKNKNSKPSLDWLSIVKTTEAKKHIRAWFRTYDPASAIIDGRLMLEKELTAIGLNLDKLNRERVNQVLRTFSAKNLDSLLARIGIKDISAIDVVRNAFPQEKKIAVAMDEAVKKTAVQKKSLPGDVQELTIGGQKGFLYKLGKCCNPVRGQAVAGYITRAKGVTVHQTICKNIKNASSNRIISAEWI